MNYFLVGDLNNNKVIFGQGNTERTALAAGKWNATQRDAEKLRITREDKLPKNAVWYHKL
jgi:hypothetical protein